GWIGSIRSTSVVVDEFDIFRTSIHPNEADSPLRIDPAAVLPSTVADQFLQPVTGRNPQALHILRRVDDLQHSQDRVLSDAVNTLDEFLVPGSLGVLAPERPDHEILI